MLNSTPMNRDGEDDDEDERGENSMWPSLRPKKQ